jgi:hypothetical protein
MARLQRRKQAAVTTGLVGTPLFRARDGNRNSEKREMEIFFRARVERDKQIVRPREIRLSAQAIFLPGGRGSRFP